MALPLYNAELITKDRGWHVNAVYAPQNFSPEYLAALEELTSDKESPGHSDVGVRNLLFSLILSLRPEYVLEIGGHIGSATIVMAEAVRMNNFGKVFTIEPQDHYHQLLQSYVSKSGNSERVKILKGFSNDAEIQKILQSTAPFELIFLDACHDYAPVFSELALCEKILSENGLIVCHDTSVLAKSFDATNSGGVRQAILDYCAQNPNMVSQFLEYPLWLNNCGAAILCKQNLKPKNKKSRFLTGIFNKK